MEMMLKLSKEDLEYILYEHFSDKGLEPTIKINKDMTAEVELEYDYESFNSKI